MSQLSPEIDCACDDRVHIEWLQTGDLQACVNCGRRYISTDDDLIYVEE